MGTVEGLSSQAKKHDINMLMDFFLNLSVPFFFCNAQIANKWYSNCNHLSS